MSKIVPVILSGGSGSRLWPVSTPTAPKQFQPLVGVGSMFSQTLARASDRTRFTAPIIVCGGAHVGHVRTDLDAAKITDAQIVIEPAARNTAPAIALASLLVRDQDADAQILVMPADHVMTDVAAFLAAVETVRAVVEKGALATFGISPSYPETGYGYIAAGSPLAQNSMVHHVERFVEKPPRDKAEDMLAKGGHYWNAGIFLMHAEEFLKELNRQQPRIAQSCQMAMDRAQRDGQCIYPETEAFSASPSDSIDYAVMENARNVVVIPVDPGWSDVGGWAALHALDDKDMQGNVCSGDVLAVEANNNYFRADKGRRIAAVGVSNLVVVSHGNDILIVPKDRTQEVREVAARLTSPSSPNA
ncbi:mannose-1-phosphate guanylyltransferase/mannose-6-phosphate isomerase [Sphingopyxis sp. MWB1]|uniref:mannose-1-phosphate guanylyltransferase/mannose-6-phosphate isomerase n=1 Tax=Sphingopyxis sp. MWB1 TaxID=1537715 RepID=UPI00051A0070|nr:mannose-1-phosphate guanylyltransferase/mannose-6-phosphate isomerase [Sphingopyxis sp. MWB1]